MRVFITGIAGFAGSHLAELLLNDGEEVLGTFLQDEPLQNIEVFQDDLRLFPCDVRDADTLKKIMKEVQPEEIYHLAAIAFIPASINDPRATFETNLLGTLNVFEAAKGMGGNPRILFVGSADEYGMVANDELPVTEDNPLRPASPYSVSKVSASLLAYQYALAENAHVVRTRSFNHTGPRQSSQFVCSDFARQIVEAEMGKGSPEVHVGNLKPKRDFTDVRDVVRAYRDVLRHGEPCEVYNICSGTSVGIGEILDMLISLSGRQIRVVERPERTRKCDVDEIRGDYGKIKSTAGWMPLIPLDKTLEDMIEYWRQVV